MTLALAISFAIAGWSVGIVAWLRARSDRQDRLFALDALQRAEAVNARLRQKLSRNPSDLAHTQNLRACATEALVSGRTVDDVVREKVA